MPSRQTVEKVVLPQAVKKFWRRLLKLKIEL